MTYGDVKATNLRQTHIHLLSILNYPQNAKIRKQKREEGSMRKFSRVKSERKQRRPGCPRLEPPLCHKLTWSNHTCQSTDRWSGSTLVNITTHTNKHVLSVCGDSL